MSGSWTQVSAYLKTHWCKARLDPFRGKFYGSNWGDCGSSKPISKTWAADHKSPPPRRGTWERRAQTARWLEVCGCQWGHGTPDPSPVKHDRTSAWLEKPQRQYLQVGSSRCLNHRKVKWFQEATDAADEINASVDTIEASQSMYPPPPNSPLTGAWCGTTDILLTATSSHIPTQGAHRTCLKSDVREKSTHALKQKLVGLKSFLTLTSSESNHHL